MTIGIDASRAFVENRTGIEEYSYQVIKSLAYRQAGLVNKLEKHQARPRRCASPSERVVLYVRKNQEVDFNLPSNWKIKVVKWPYLWTQIGLSLELLFHPVDSLFVPAHTVPFVRSRNTVVTVHGLEYEFCPKAYSFWEKIYMRFVIKNSVKWAKKIITVSENTKRDLIDLYKVPKDKIKVIYEGISENFQFSNSNPAYRQTDFQSNSNNQFNKKNTKYLLFIGRIEERKNICGIIKAFGILKEKYNIPHKLILAGKPGYGFEEIKNQILKFRNKEDFIFKGFVKDDEKFGLVKNSDVFLFPSFYEGFGLPILEAQSVGVPVITSNISSMPEVSDSSAILVDPYDTNEIAEAAYKLISDEKLRNDIVNRGFENVKRFSWDRCAEEIEELLKN